jgi:carbonic anhydrase/acetyltransferase-like protein (isoleucine patch superfamily)
MLLSHKGEKPKISASSRIAPNAVICGDVTIGSNCSIGFGCVLVAESGPICIGDNCIVMDTAVLRGVRDASLTIGNNVLIGPRAYLSGCSIEDDVFLATGATVFNKARVGKGSEVRVNGLVHLRTVLPPHSMVPIGWVAVGDPATILPSSEQDQIWSIQKPLDFPRVVFGVDRPPPGETMMPNVMPDMAGACSRIKPTKCCEVNVRAWFRSTFAPGCSQFVILGSQAAFLDLASAP